MSQAYSVIGVDTLVANHLGDPFALVATHRTHSSTHIRIRFHSLDLQLIIGQLDGLRLALVFALPLIHCPFCHQPIQRIVQISYQTTTFSLMIRLAGGNEGELLLSIFGERLASKSISFN
jgi:hypothetical protein